MPTRQPLIRSLFMAIAFAACAGPDGDAPEGAGSPPMIAAGLTGEYFHGDWCQRFTPPADADAPDEEPVEEVLFLRFEPGGRFALGRSLERLASVGDWSLEDGVLRMPGNPVAGRPKPERISADEFHFQFMGVPIQVTRGACSPA